MTLLPPHLSNGDVVKNGGWVPVGIQVVVGLQERTPRYPKLVKKSDKVLWIDHQSCSGTGMHVISSFFPVFASYALNISLNDCFGAQWLGAVMVELLLHTLVSPAIVKERFFSFSVGRCVRI